MSQPSTPSRPRAPITQGLPHSRTRPNTPTTSRTGVGVGVGASSTITASPSRSRVGGARPSTSTSLYGRLAALVDGGDGDGGGNVVGVDRLRGSRSMSRIRLGAGGAGGAGGGAEEDDLNPSGKELHSGNGMDVRPGAAAAAGGAAGGKDKVVVCVRAKPSTTPATNTSTTATQSIYTISPSNTIELSSVHPNVVKRGGKAKGREGEYRFSFDNIHLPPHPTTTLYERSISPLVTKAMQGFNSTVFAYGQTGSGKTWTMSGTEDEPGIIPLAIAGVFDAIENNPTRSYLLRVSYLEIYNESIRDLLCVAKKPLSDADKPTLHVENGQVVVRPLVEEIVRMPQEIMQILKKGERNRKTAGTDWNERSSRSHAVFTITIESRDGADIRRSRLTLIDLAGSEKAASNVERLSEGKYINKSLLALGTVIEQLADKTRKPGSHVPYRNSKLTHLLENAIGGNANIAVICTLSLEEHHASETLETLKFASRCAQVETKAVKGVLPASEKALLKAKEEEIQELKLQLDALNNQRKKQDRDAAGPVPRHELADELEEMEARRDRLFAQLSRLNGEILSSKNIGQNHFPRESPAMRNHRRVSDFSRGQIGLGKDLVNAVLTPRRAVSGVVPTTVQASPPLRKESIETDLIRAAREKSQAEKGTIAALQEALAVSQAEVASLRGVHTDLADLKRKFGDESAKRAELQRLWEEQKEARACLEVDLAVANENAGSLRQELDEARAQAAAAATKTAQAASTAAPADKDQRGLPLPPPAEPPLRHSRSLKEYRLILEPSEALPYTPSSRQTSRETEQIQRLETIVKGLKSVNEELLSKIAQWRQQVLQQDDLIKSMIAGQTAAPAEPMTPRKLGTERTTIVLSPSTSFNTPRTPPLGGQSSSPKKGHHRTDSAYSHFGASPPPLPIAPSMISNASRRGRRITIENDIGRLQSGSKVDRVRALFSGNDFPAESQASPRAA